MSVTGYSDRINHALAYAAKHHAQQVWKGNSRVPYFTYPANLAVILTRYGQDDDTVIAGVLHEVVSDCMRAGQTREMLEERVGSKFGPAVLDALLAVAERKADDDGIELSIDERKSDVLDRLEPAGARARWIVAASLLHTGGSLLADLRRTSYPETVWGRFSGEREDVVASFRRTVARLRDVGFDAPIMAELTTVIDALERLAAESSDPAPRLAR